MTILSVVATGFTAAGLPAALHRSARHPKNCLTGINRTNQRRARIAAKKFEEMHFCAGSLSAPWAPDLKSSLQARPDPALHLCTARLHISSAAQVQRAVPRAVLQRRAPCAAARCTGRPWRALANVLCTSSRLFCPFSPDRRKISDLHLLNLWQELGTKQQRLHCNDNVQVEGYTLSWIYAN